MKSMLNYLLRQAASLKRLFVVTKHHLLLASLAVLTLYGATTLVPHHVWVRFYQEVFTSKVGAISAGEDNDDER